MNQIWTVARWDLRRQRREGGLLLIVAIVAALLVSALVDGARRTNSATRAFSALHTRLATMSMQVRSAASVDTSSAQVPLEWGVRNPDFVANDRGTLALAPPAPLLALSVGRTDLHPTQVKVTASGRDTTLTASEIAHPMSLATGAFDVTFVLLFLWPLAIIASMFDLVASDRERGMLQLLLAQPAAASALVAGPAAGRGAALLAGALVVPPLLNLLPAYSLDVPRLMLWSAVVLAYGTFWVGLAVWVNGGRRPAATNAAWLAGAWLVLTLVVPGAVGVVTTTWSAVPSGVAFADATRAATRDALSDGSRVLGHFLEDHPSAAAVGRDGLRQYALLQAARDREVERRLQPMIARYEAALDKQRRVAAVLQFLSPTILAGNALEQAAGTSRDRATHFARQADRFRSEWRDFFQSRILRAEALTVEDAAALPQFRYREQPWSSAAVSTAPAVVTLLLCTAGLVFFGLRRGRKDGGDRS